MIRIGIVGTGQWANDHAKGYASIRGARVAACCDVDEPKAQAFARKHDIPQVYTGYMQMLREEKLDAVDVVTTDAMHAEVSIAAAKAGLAVFCEKPLATSVAQARKMAQAVRRAGVVNMVNFTNRNASALHKAQRMITQGRLGRIIHVEAGYMQSWLSSRIWGDWRNDPGWLWRLSTRHGSGGVLYDIGCHVLDFVTFAVGDIASLSCRLETFDKGVGTKKYKGYVLDANDSAITTAKFANGAIGTIRCSRWAAGFINTLYLDVFGSKGSLRINLDDGRDRIRICLGKDIHTGTWNTLRCGKGKSTYRCFVESVRTGRNDSPTFTEGLKIQQYLEKCEQAAQLAREIKA
ncbi:MAG: Gfo/Idh/MocA family oxidoreductase [Sedimentisphaerales bacterium]|nr:Gfo/Idh/MocA family oxidoreductase [Sedimentisphaerales bacterium]